jgi:hypothetical protein
MTMRIKAVLRDTDILNMEVGSKGRIFAAVRKNIDRLINFGSLLKVMGLSFEDRCTMLETLKDTNIHIWFSNDGDQHLVYFSENKNAEESVGYQWQ